MRPPVSLLFPARGPGADTLLRPILRGIVNVTPDSFSDGGLHADPEAAAAHALRLLEEGADIVDIGGESTRPPGRSYGAGSLRVDAKEEVGRVVPVVELIRSARPDAVISVDTMKGEVARKALEAGADIINDVSAGRFDPVIRNVAAKFDVPYILMHGHDPADLRPADTFIYRDLIGEVYRFLQERIASARNAGVSRIIADVGIGFAKGGGENALLLRRHREFLDLGVPMLVGASRKAFIGALLGGAPPGARVNGTLAAHAIAAINGASILRVHDVRPAREFFDVFYGVGLEGHPEGADDFRSNA